MEGLIPILNQGAEFIVDSRHVADLFNIQHKSLRELIESHEAELTRLGFWRFETAKITNDLGRTTKGRPEKFYWLTFDQVIYLLTLTKSTAETREFRVQLILAFRAARERFRPVDAYLLSIPERWRKTFKDDFYVALLGIYGADYDASKNKPSWVGAWTNRFIYEPIYAMMATELKAKRKAYCGSSGKDPEFIKLHQFLEEHARDDLRDHMTKITTLLQLSGSKYEFAEHFRSVFHGNTQLRMDGLLDDRFS